MGDLSTLGNYSRKSSWLLNSSWLRKSLSWDWSLFYFRSLKYRIILKRSERTLLCTCLRVKVLIAQLCLTLCHPMDCSPPCSSVHGILQARILEWVAMPSSRASFQPRDQTQFSCIADRYFTIWATRDFQVDKIKDTALILWLVGYILNLRKCIISVRD